MSDIPTGHMIDDDGPSHASLQAMVMVLEHAVKKQEVQIILQAHDIAELSTALRGAQESAAEARGEAIEWRSKVEGLETKVHALQTWQEGAAPIGMAGAKSSLNLANERLVTAMFSLSQIASESRDDFARGLAHETIQKIRTGSQL
jgi:hypothetical protein